MFANGRKTIGLFIFNPHEDYEGEVIRAASLRAKQLGYNLAVFSNYGAFGITGNAHEIGEMMIFDLPDYEKLAGVILAIDTFSIQEACEQILHYIREQCSCPVVTLRKQIDGFNNILIREGNSMQEITRHIIEVHGKKDIAFMSGPEDRVDAQERLASFQSVMEEYGYPIGEHRVFYGDFWRGKGKEACDWFSYDGTFPQAIVCANDHMAYAIADELFERGVRVPEDVLVTGYDGLSEGSRYDPKLTTARINFYRMAEKAVDLINDHQGDTDLEEIYVEPELVLRRSCGCVDTSDICADGPRRSLHRSVITNMNLEMQFSFMTIDLSGVKKINELHEVVTKYIYNLENFQHYYICLRDDIEEKKDEFKGYTERMHVRVALRDRQDLGEVDIPFDRHTLLPAEFTGEEPQFYLFLPIHYRESGYGYEAYCFGGEDRYGKTYGRWNISIGNTIYNINVYNRMNDLIAQLENMYIQDVLTGLYNRRGFENFVRGQFEEAKAKKQMVCVIGIDMDGLKPINDIYGHHEGDSALCAVAYAIREASVLRQVSARIGGDEFEVFFPCRDEAAVDEWVTTFEGSLDKYNDKSGKPYKVHASYGYRMGIPAGEDTLESYMKESDDLMYKNKIENKRRRNETLR